MDAFRSMQRHLVPAAWAGVNNASGIPDVCVAAKRCAAVPGWVTRFGSEREVGVALLLHLA